MQNYWNDSTKTMHMHDTTLKGQPFCLSVHHEDDGFTVKAISLEFPAYTSISGDVVGAVSTSLRVKHWGDVYYRLTRGIEIPRNWFSHNEA